MLPTTLAIVKKVNFLRTNFMPLDRHRTLAANHIKLIESINVNIDAIKISEITGKYVLFWSDACDICVKLSNLFEKL